MSLYRRKGREKGREKEMRVDSKMLLRDSIWKAQRKREKIILVSSLL